MSQESVLEKIRELGMATTRDVALQLDLSLSGVQKSVLKLRVCGDIEFAGYKIKKHGKSKLWRVRER